MILYLLIMILATVVPLLLAVAFLTLVERRVMGAMQRRQGPNAWGAFGVLQPFLDGLKLLLKEPVLPSSADQALFLWAPILTFLTSQIAWAALPTSAERTGAVRDLNLGTMYVLRVGSLGVYGILLAGWASNSKYAFLGCCRSVAQMISYELPMGLIVLSACMIANSLNWSALVSSQAEASWFLFSLWPMALIWIVCCLAELNRAPFDLVEAERELVAGYNVEYSSMGFALFFIREYRSMIMMGAVTSLLFLGGGSAPFTLFGLFGWLPSRFWIRLKTTLVVFVYIWVRATLPRYRYRDLMTLGWKRLLPLTLGLFFFNLRTVFCMQLV
uniref:NADH-ubiquinone oxidoreductase chain 1 n=1 Tax=Sphaeropleales sp. YC001 TaxID=1715688 RepID=A0A0N9HGV7_9CHLO|nr:NADH dehydrogenase subunit 1 [Sphaeropleales sp. YC001]